MRADRLLSILLLLQARGRQTACQLAEQLEVSERTIYRDIIALSTSGVPIYTERGPGGGIALIEEYRTTLTGLTREEVRALFMLSIPVPLADLGFDQDLRGALLKLSAALPKSLQGDSERARGRIYIDSSVWGPADEPVPHLRTIQQAVWDELRLHIHYSSILGMRSAPLEAWVEPYGLVSKAGVWYLVCMKGANSLVIPLSRILDVQMTTDRFTRQPEFELIAFWKSWCTKTSDLRSVYPVKLRVSPDLMPFLPGSFSRQVKGAIQNTGLPDQQGWWTITLVFEYFEEARASLLKFGRALEVLEPYALRQSLVDYARQIIDFYSESP